MLKELQACQSRADLATLLGVSHSELAYTLYKMPLASRYASFCISKKNGGTRHILAPSQRLKWLQKRLLDALYQCESEIEARNGRPHNLQFGFRRGINIFDNANAHKARRFVLNFDIKDFFDQFNFGRVRGFFIHDREFTLHPSVATVIAQIACFDDKLPQGSPCSPHIANLVSRFVDIRLTRYLRKRRCCYTRYADDITVSTDLRKFPEEVAFPDPSIPQGWDLHQNIYDILARAGFSVNPAKIRMSVFSSRQMVTGLVANVKPNVNRNYYLVTRAMCHSLFKKGAVTAPKTFDGFGSNCLEAGEKDTKIPNPVNVLEGRLSHILHIRDKNDNRTIQEKQDNPTQTWRLLQQFYIFKHFIGNEYPTIITEGPSDIFYLKEAAFRSSKSFPHIVDKCAKNPKLLIRFFKFGTQASRLLALGGGAGNIKRFIYLYKTTSHRFEQSLQKQPVIIVSDNDKAGSDVASMLNGIYKSVIKPYGTILSHQVTKNLHFVQTPVPSGANQSCIEDLLPASVRNVKLNGKTFSCEAKFDASKHFGKMALANYVRANAGSIDFSSFEPMLEAIEESIAKATA